LLAQSTTEIGERNDRKGPLPYAIAARQLGAAEIEIKLDRIKRVLAAEMGTTTETLSSTLAKFRDEKFLRVKGNTDVATRPRELQKLLQRNLGEL
jgi:CRP/FNR family transcriptional regulator